MIIEATVQIWREGEAYVAHAMPVDVMSAGPTPAAAREAVDEAVRVFAATLADQGTLADVLEECGYVREGDRWRAPAFVAVERHDMAMAG